MDEELVEIKHENQKLKDENKGKLKAEDRATSFREECRVLKENK